MTGEPAGTSDADLLGEALAGGKSAFTLFIRRHQETVYRFVRRYVGDSEEASQRRRSSSAARTSIQRP